MRYNGKTKFLVIAALAAVTGLSMTACLEPDPGPTETEVPGTDLAAKLAWIKTNAQINKIYLVTVDKDAGIFGTDQSSNDGNNLSYTGKNNITIRLDQ